MNIAVNFKNVIYHQRIPRSASPISPSWIWNSFIIYRWWFLWSFLKPPSSVTYSRGGIFMFMSPGAQLSPLLSLWGAVLTLPHVLSLTASMYDGGRDMWWGVVGITNDSTASLFRVGYECNIMIISLCKVTLYQVTWDLYCYIIRGSVDSVMILWQELPGSFSSWHFWGIILLIYHNKYILFTTWSFSISA